MMMMIMMMIRLLNSGPMRASICGVQSYLYA